MPGGLGPFDLIDKGEGVGVRMGDGRVVGAARWGVVVMCVTKYTILPVLYLFGVKVKRRFRLFGS